MKEQENVESVEMSEAARAARREAHRKWQRENREKVREYQARYWNRRAMLARSEES